MAPTASVRTGSAAPVASDPLELVARLCEALTAEGVRYCHWKSTATLDRAALGEGDLDLLVERRGSQRFQEILRRLGFKEARGGREIPGVFHAYGFDAPSGRLVHVHAHYALVLGDDMTKNYRLPVEDAYLASTTQGAVFRVPASEFELAVLVVRLVLKHATWDAIVIGLGPLSAAERYELEDLTRRVATGAVRACVRTHLPLIGESIWEDCRRALEPGAGLWFRVRTARRLEAALATYGRRSAAIDTLLKLSRRVGGFLLRRLAPHRRARLRLDSGGAFIAIVGDDAGRSAAVSALHGWLARDLETVKLHLAKPSRSLPAQSAQEASRQRSIGVRAFARLARDVIQTRGPYREYLRARRLASRGALVICHGVPMPRLGLKDGSAARQGLDEPGPGGLVRYLASLEARYFDLVVHPDLLIVLGAGPGPDVAGPEELWRGDWPDGPACVLDAGRPQEDVLFEIKRCVWSSL